MVLLDSKSKQINTQQTAQLHLLFSLGADRYALNVHEVVEVIHLRPIKQLLDMPAWVVGLLDYRQQIVPVLDLSARTGLVASNDKTSTRIVIVNYHSKTNMDSHTYLLGLILQQATDTLRCLPEDFKDYGIEHPEALYLGPVLQHATLGLIQRITINQLLPDEIHSRLFLGMSQNDYIVI